MSMFKVINRVIFYFSLYDLWVGYRQGTDYYPEDLSSGEDDFCCIHFIQLLPFIGVTFWKERVPLTKVEEEWRAFRAKG